MTYTWFWRPGFKTKIVLWKGIQKRAMPVVNGLEILCCEEKLNDRADLMERKEWKMLGSGGEDRNLHIPVRLMHNGRKPCVFHVCGGKDRLGLNSSKEC